mgnify:CR=1 FL=1
MDEIDLNKIFLTDLRIFPSYDGDVLHAIKNSDNGYVNFGEAYFSKINYKNIKGWKRHKRMTMNLIVPIGTIKFVFIDNKRKKAIINHTPLKRFGKVDELIAPILLLASDSSSFITGSELTVDGGFSSMTI